MSENETNQAKSEEDYLTVKHEVAISSLRYAYSFMLISVFFVWVPFFGICVFGFLTILTLILSVLSFGRIRRSNGTLRDNGFVMPSIYTLLILAGMVLLYLFGSSMSGTYDTNYSDISQLEDLFNNAKRNGLDIDENWCDILSSDSETIDTCLKKYCLNEEVLRLGKSTPHDMIMVFPSVKNEWNQVGSIDLLDTSAGSPIYLLTRNKTVVSCPPSKVKYLKWREGDKGVFPKTNIYIVSVLVLLVSALVVFNIISKRLVIVKDVYPAIIVVSVASTFFGGYFSHILEILIASDLYFSNADGFKNIGWSLGSAIGAISGICFCTLMFERTEKANAGNYSPTGYRSLYGIVAGALSAAISCFYISMCYEPLLASVIRSMSISMFVGAIMGVIVQCFGIIITRKPKLINTHGDICDSASAAG